MKLDPAHIYTLSELIDLAEQNNPATREAWAFAKGRATQLGISRSDLYPTLVAGALGATSKDGVLINENFALQSVGKYDLAMQNFRSTGLCSMADAAEMKSSKHGLRRNKLRQQSIVSGMK